MITDEIRSSLLYSATELLKAKEEMNRPEEDVVAISACTSARNTMKQIMQQYLSVHSSYASDSLSINELIELCASFNPAFKTVKMGSIECKGMDHNLCDGKYCLSVERVSDCIVAADHLKNIVWKEFMM